MKRLMILGAMIMMLTSCRVNDSSTGFKDNDEKIPVNVSESQSRLYIPSIELSGVAFADKEANLGAALPGRVEKIYFPEGSQVRKGDLLVSLSGELYTQALVEFNTIEKDFDRVSRLNEKGSVSQQDFDHVKAMYDASRSKVEMMKKNAEIIAPFPGTIVEYLVNEGENYFFNINLEPGYSKTSGILRLMKLDPIQLKVEVNEKDLDKLQKGQAVSVKFDAFPSLIFNGKLSMIEQVLSTLTHSAIAKVELENSTNKIKPGMFAHVKIGLSPLNTVAVPMNAVYRQPGTTDDYLFIVENDRVRRQKIERLWDDDVWVGVNGISSEETIVTSGKEKLHNGSLIEIKQAEEK